MARRTRHNHENIGSKLEDNDMTRLAREAMSVERSQEKAATSERRTEDRWFEDEEEAAVSDAIPPLPQATPIPGHSKAVAPERVTQARLNAQATEPRDAQEAMPAVGNYGEVDPEVMPSGPEARRAWPVALVSGALAAPVAALRMAGHVVSKVACKIGVLRQRGEEKWQETRARLKTS